MKTIIEMAREAGFSEWAVKTPRDLERFAALVAAAEREAMVTEAAKKGWGMRNDDPFEDCVREIADIRARGQSQVCCQEYNTCVRPCTPRGRHHGQEAEREACAKQLDALGCDHCAAAIRARGQEIDPNQWAFDNGLEST